MKHKNENVVRELILLSTTDILSGSVKTKTIINHIQQYCKHVAKAEDIDIILESMDHLNLQDTLLKYNLKYNVADKSLTIKEVISSKFKDYRKS